MATTDTMKRMRLSFGRLLLFFIFKYFSFKIKIYKHPILTNRRGRELLKKEREGLSWFGRIIHDIKQRYRLFKTRRRDQFIPIWRHEIKYIETNFGGFYSSFFIFSRFFFNFKLILNFNFLF